MYKIFNIFIFSFFCFFLGKAYSKTINEIIISGNERIPTETINLFSDIKIGDNFDEIDLNKSLKNLYELNFFKDIKINFVNGVISIDVIENPIIENVIYDGLRSVNKKNEITKNLLLKSRSSFTKYLLEKDINSIYSNLKDLGYYNARVETFIEDLGANKINLNYKILLGDKAKIKKITFLGNKIYKDSTLKNIILSEENRFWKFLSKKKFINENLINIDTRLLKNFYLNKGFYDVRVNSSFAKFTEENASFELIFNIDAKNKYYFNNISLEIPIDYDMSFYDDLSEFFNDLKGEVYNLNSVNKILDKIDLISISEQYVSVKASVVEEIYDDKIDLKFIIEETPKFTIQKINIFGNAITKENVIRNQLLVDEGDIFNEIQNNKSINNLKSLNIFRNVNSNVFDTENRTKIINISVEEKPTGEIFAGAGIGTSGTTFTVGVKENNYLGEGINLDTNFTVNTNSLKGKFSFINPNFKNSDKSLFFDFEALEIDNLSTYGYKTNKIGLSFGNGFEFLDDTFLRIGNSNFLETIETDDNASSLQKKQSGDYFDSFINLNLNYDKRNQKFKTSNGFISSFESGIPIISKKNYTFSNSYNFKIFKEFYENNISTFSIYLQSANSLTGENIKLSERLFVPSSRLRGFENGKIGPKDGEDFIGGNFITTLNFSSTLPKLLPDLESIDFSLFSDVANIWGVDYDSSLDKNNKVRSSIGFAVDWFTPIGPLNFSFSQPLSKSSTDIVEKFRFNLGTSF